MSPGLTTERVYAMLKAQIMGGERHAGERLDPARLASELNASATPVRDALHQLLGERMVEARPSQGFQVPVPGEGALRELYAWNSDLLSLLLRGWKPQVTPRDVLSSLSIADSADAARALFETIAARLGNSEQRIAIRQASDRLHRARIAEAVVFADLVAEHEALLNLWSTGRGNELRTALIRYHRRREKHVQAIVAKLLDGGQRP